MRVALPSSIVQILRSPADELDWGKLEQVQEAIESEIQDENIFFDISLSRPNCKRIINLAPSPPTPVSVPQVSLLVMSCFFNQNDMSLSGAWDVQGHLCSLPRLFPLQHPQQCPRQV